VEEVQAKLSGCGSPSSLSVSFSLTSLTPVDILRCWLTHAPCCFSYFRKIRSRICHRTVMAPGIYAFSMSYRFRTSHPTYHPHPRPLLCLLYVSIFDPLQSINKFKGGPRSSLPPFRIISDLRDLLFHNLQGTEHPRQVKPGELVVVVVS